MKLGCTSVGQHKIFFGQSRAIIKKNFWTKVTGENIFFRNLPRQRASV
jgi:hypothetical protein